MAETACSQIKGEANIILYNPDPVELCPLPDLDLLGCAELDVLSECFCDYIFAFVPHVHDRLSRSKGSTWYVWINCEEPGKDVVLVGITLTIE